jgi:hypothetical protein
MAGGGEDDGAAVRSSRCCGRRCRRGTGGTGIRCARPRPRFRTRRTVAAPAPNRASRVAAIAVHVDTDVNRSAARGAVMVATLDPLLHRLGLHDDRHASSVLWLLGPDRTARRRLSVAGEVGVRSSACRSSPRFAERTARERRRPQARATGACQRRAPCEHPRRRVAGPNEQLDVIAKLRRWAGASDAASSRPEAHSSASFTPLG